MKDWFDEGSDTLWDKEYENLHNGLNVDGSEIVHNKIPRINSKWRHRNGIKYEVICISNLESKNFKYAPQVIYQGENGNVWSRPLSDWNRSFTKI